MEDCESRDTTINEDEANLYYFQDVKPKLDPVHMYDLNRYSGVPLVIDNGTSHCRAGWATHDEPSLIFRNLIAKIRKDKFKKGGIQEEILVGNEINNMDAVKFGLRSPFDRNVMCQPEVQESILDYVFYHLGINTKGSVNHPILLTEPLCCPNYSRSLLSEILFELYHVPAVAYGIDGMFSFFYNHPKIVDGLVLNLGHHTTHVLPVLDAKLDLNGCRRINVGGMNALTFLHRLLQLKYPAHVGAITYPRCEEVAIRFCHIPDRFQECLEKWADEDYYLQNVVKIQLPFNPINAMASNPETIKEKRQQQARRLVEMNIRKREEKLASDENRLQQMISVKEMLEDDEEDVVQQSLLNLGFSSIHDLQVAIKDLMLTIERSKLKLSGSTPADDAQEPPPKKLCSKYTRPEDEEEFKKWLKNLQDRRMALLDKKLKRKQMRSDMARRRTKASQERMRIISQLARKEKKNKEDTFGMKDEDWDVYKVISKDRGDSDSEVEQEEVYKIECILKQHDPSFHKFGDEADEYSNPAEFYQLHLGTELIRTPEVIFQPSMLGIDQCGLSHSIEYILKLYDTPTQDRLVSNVFLTGGFANYPGIFERIKCDLLMMRPFQSSFAVNMAGNPSLDSWYGMCAWAKNPDNAQYFITKQDYEEKGGDYLKENQNSNKYFPTPNVKPILDST